MKVSKTVIHSFIGLVALIMGAKLNIAFGEVPITLQVPVVVAVGAFACWQVGLIVPVVYMLLGLFLPVFAGDTYGMDVYTGATVGFIVMFPVAGYLAGKLAHSTLSMPMILAGTLLAQTVVMAGGVIGLMIVKDLTFALAFKYGFTDLALIGYGKMLAVAIIIWMVRR